MNKLCAGRLLSFDWVGKGVEVLSFFGSDKKGQVYDNPFEQSVGGKKWRR